MRIRESEIGMLASAYGLAKSRFSQLKDALASGKVFEQIDLRSHLGLGQLATSNQHSRPCIPLHMAKALEQVRWSDGFQNGDPDAICIAAEKYMAAIGNRTYLQLSALNFLRLLSSQEDYRQEVTKFVEGLKTGYAPSSGEYFGPFSGPDQPITCWRLALHEHLDAIMSRADQRDLVRAVYARWVSTVNQRRDEALLSIYDDEIRLRFAAGDKLGAYRAACMAETDGLYRRDDGYGALVLRRTAQHVDREFGDDAAADPSVIGHLNDAEMEQVAENYSEAQLSEWDALEGPDPFPAHLWPPDDGVIDE